METYMVICIIRNVKVDQPGFNWTENDETFSDELFTPFEAENIVELKSLLEKNLKELSK